MDQENNGRTKDQRKSDSTQTGFENRTSITFDANEYRHYVESFDLTEEQERELLEALWNIIVQFVDMGFGIHPVQQAQNACGQLDKNPRKAAPKADYGVKSKHDILIKHFEDVANSEPERAAEGFE